MLPEVDIHAHPIKIGSVDGPSPAEVRVDPSLGCGEDERPLDLAGLPNGATGCWNYQTRILNVSTGTFYPKATLNVDLEKYCPKEDPGCAQVITDANPHGELSPDGKLVINIGPDGVDLVRLPPEGDEDALSIVPGPKISPVEQSPHGRGNPAWGEYAVSGVAGILLLPMVVWLRRKINRWIHPPRARGLTEMTTRPRPRRTLGPMVLARGDHVVSSDVLRKLNRDLTDDLTQEAVTDTAKQARRAKLEQETDIALREARSKNKNAERAEKASEKLNVCGKTESPSLVTMPQRNTTLKWQKKRLADIGGDLPPFLDK